jgi:UPF0755 protein
MWRNIASNALTLFIVVLVLLSGLLTMGRKMYNDPGPLAQSVCFKVERGATLSAVSQGLAQAGAISDARIFRIGANYSGQGDELKFGSYLIRPGASMVEIISLVTTGGQSTCGQEVNYVIGVASAQVTLQKLDPATDRYVEVVKFAPGVDPVPVEYTEAAADADLRWRVTLAEGVTSWNVVEALKAADFLEGEIAEGTPEGTLAPESYDVVKGADRGELLAQMAARQTATLAELWANRAEGLPYATPQEALIMASIVEKETGIAAERRQVASVFLNRLAQGMKLQTDPTVIYGVTKGQGILGRGLRQSELRRETPWNTYVIDGLPATPIANPGRLSIEAALSPDTTPYIFFVADGTGGHAFAVTLEEHNINVARWRTIEASQGVPVEE